MVEEKESGYELPHHYKKPHDITLNATEQQWNPFGLVTAKQHQMS